MAEDLRDRRDDRAEYLNVFVLVVQVFRRVPVLKALAPTQSEPQFAVVQLVVLLAFVVLTVLVAKKFKASAPLAKAMGAGR